MLKCLMYKNLLGPRLLILSSCLLMSIPAFSQDLEPRRWTPLPEGMNVLGLGYGHTSGDVLFDPVLQISEAKVKADSSVLAYVHAFKFAGKSLRFDMQVPWTNVKWEGTLSGEAASTERKGFADPRFRLSVNLLNISGEELTEKGFFKSDDGSRTVVGAALAVKVPWGEYYADKLLNIGENRYMIRPQIGVVHTRGAWAYELTGSIFFYSDNDAFYNGHTRTQDPLYAMQTHVVYTFKPGYWASLSAGYGLGGESSLDTVPKDDAWGNFMGSVSYGFPLSENQSLKAVYLHAKTQRITGAITDTFALGWSIRF